jgi:tetratricopeptide (TPR) repeat protein
VTLEPGMDNAEHAMTLASGYMEAHNYRRAEEVLREALVHDPHNASLLTELARAQHLSGDNNAAQRSALAALTVSPENAYAMSIYASILVELGRHTEGLEWARRAVNTAPLHPGMHYEYARLLAFGGLAADALPVVDEALRLAPAEADAHDLRGVILSMLGRRKESTAEHEEALRLEPGHARAVANMAANRANSRNLSAALAGFAEAGRLDPHIGDDLRRNITATVRQWLSWTTVAAWAALWFSVQLHKDGEPASPAARVITGIGCVVLVVMFGWLARSLPRHLWGPVVRQREFRSLQIYLGLGVLVLGVLGTFTLGVPISGYVLLGTLLITIAVSWLAPRFDKDWRDKADTEKH